MVIPRRPLLPMLIEAPLEHTVDLPRVADHLSGKLRTRAALLPSFTIRHAVEVPIYPYDVDVDHSAVVGVHDAGRPTHLDPAIRHRPSCSFGRSAIAAVISPQSERINQVHGVSVDVSIEVVPPGEADGILTDESSESRVVVTSSVVVDRPCGVDNENDGRGVRSRSTAVGGTLAGSASVRAVLAWIEPTKHQEPAWSLRRRVQVAG